jgi:hypothetical protein
MLHKLSTSKFNQIQDIDRTKSILTTIGLAAAATPAAAAPAALSLLPAAGPLVAGPADVVGAAVLEDHAGMTSSDPAFLALLDPRLFLPYDLDTI